MRQNALSVCPGDGRNDGKADKMLVKCLSAMQENVHTMQRAFGAEMHFVFL